MTVESVEQKIRGTRWLVPALLALILALGLASLAIGPAAIPFWTAAKALVVGRGQRRRHRARHPAAADAAWRS